MGPRIDLTGQRYGRLIFIRPLYVDGLKQWIWELQCDCGCLHQTASGAVKSGNTKSCGCLAREAVIRRNKANRLSYSASRDHRYEYIAWRNMVTRCYNKRDRSYEYYGKRGITVCTRWRKSFEAFFADMGIRPTPKHSVDRFPDLKGNYEPSNCRWASSAQQARNKTDNVMVTYKGKTQCVTDWAAELNIGKATIAYRLRVGWSAEDALTVATNHGNGWRSYASVLHRSPQRRKNNTR